MNTVIQGADELRAEVDRIVGEPRSFAGAESSSVYMQLRERGAEHGTARIQAIAATIGTLRSRAVLADDIHPENAFALRRTAQALHRALAKGVA